MTAAGTAFASLPATAQHHFRLYYFAAAIRVANAAADGGLLEEFPFLVAYRDELELLGAADRDDAWWAQEIAGWERRVSGHLPLRALRDAGGLDHGALAMLFAIGLVEEDARFGAVFQAFQGGAGAHRPTVGLLHAWWSQDGAARGALQRLRELGLVRVTNAEAPRVEWALEVRGVLWDALRGDASARPLPWLRHRPAAELAELDSLVLADGLRATAARLPALLRDGAVRTLIVRGPRHGGRRTLVGAVARALGRGVVEAEQPATPGGELAASASGAAIDERARIAGVLATLLHAVPVLVVDPAPGEKASVPALAGCDAPCAIVLGRQGGLDAGLERAITLAVDLPDPAARRAHWERQAGIAEDELDAIAERFRLTSGHIHLAARLARSYASLAGRDAVVADDVREAIGALDRQALDTLATRVDATGSWSELAVAADVHRELGDLERRCRQRERLHAAVGAAVGRHLRPGVRALFRGPSGTGKTLAARLLAAAVGMELYKVDLASVVNKYIGETEKNLSRIFALAEELDVMLLFDEGDALLARRTGVQSSNDRYANLETNYLLQRIESFDGILVLTTNAADQIDGAFARRMDVTVDFRAPGASERWQIWQLHLPAAHAVDAQLLREVATRCVLSGGQIRNAVLHAATLALDERRPIGSAHVEAAVQREYRNAGELCPLRPAPAAWSGR